MEKLQSWRELGWSCGYQVIPSLLTEANAETKFGHWVLHSVEKIGLPAPLAYQLWRWKSLTSYLYQSGTFPIYQLNFFFFQGMPLYTACMCVPAITLKCGKATGPTNSQNFHWTEIWKHEEFLQCGLQISLFELALSIQSSHHDSFSLVTLIRSRAPSQRAGMKTCISYFFLFSHLSQSEKEVHRLENLASSESSNAVYQVLVQIIAVKMFNLLAMKMLSWHWFWSCMLLNISWYFCSWAIGWNARACSDAGWDESLQGACVNTAVKKAASSHRL